MMKRNYIAMIFVVAMIIVVFTAIGIEYGIAQTLEYVVVSAVSAFVTLTLTLIKLYKRKDY